MPNALHILSQLIHITMLLGWHHYPHLTNEETEYQRDEAICLGSESDHLFFNWSNSNFICFINWGFTYDFAGQNASIP